MRIVIDPLADRRLWAFIRATKDEVGGMAYAHLETDEDGEQVINWTHTFLIPQVATASEVDFESTHGDEVAIERATADGVLSDPTFVWVSWHSHHTMKAYWSSTDAQRISALGAYGVNRLLSFVGCHDGNYELRLDVFGVSAHDIDIGHVIIKDLKLEHSNDNDFDATIADELKENVKQTKYPLTTGSTYQTNGTRINTPSTQTDGNSQPMSKREVRDELKAMLGYTNKDANRLIDSLGLDGCEDLIDKELKDTMSAGGLT